MYVAKRAFRNYNQMILPGSIVEPGNIKWFKTRLKDKVIIEVDAYNFNWWNEYFKAKYGVDLTKVEAATDETEQNVEVVQNVEVEQSTDTEQIVETETEQHVESENVEPEKPKMVTVQI